LYQLVTTIISLKLLKITIETRIKTKTTTDDSTVRTPAYQHFIYILSFTILEKRRQNNNDYNRMTNDMERLSLNQVSRRNDR
jgi:hypothetical protein